MDMVPSDAGAKELIEKAGQLIPWWGSAEDKSVLEVHAQEVELSKYYLFPIHEISVNSDCEDIPAFINERFQILLSAAYKSETHLTLVIHSKAGKVSLYAGFMKDQSSAENKEYFQSIINGILPGKSIICEQESGIHKMLDGFSTGGLMTGIPVLKKDDKDLRFNLSSVIRSLYGREYTLVINSAPVNEPEMINSFQELIDLRDYFHGLAKRTVGQEKGEGGSVSNTEGSSFGVGVGFFAGIGGFFNFNENESISESNSTQSSRSLSVEKQNGLAVELEKISDKLIERMTQGFSAGLWETSITFAAKDDLTCEILGGSFLGELSRPDENLLPPARLYTGALQKKNTLFMPRVSDQDGIFPKRLASYITSEELALISSPPTESLPGYEIKKMPALAVTDLAGIKDIKLGTITDQGNPVIGSHLYLSKSDLNKHLFVCGLTGSGKTTTVKHILKTINHEKKVPFLVLESAKRDYRQLLADKAFKKNLNVFTAGESLSPLRLNPFYIQPGVDPLVHIDFLKAIFNASFSLYASMPHILEKCLHRIYQKRGWNLTTGTHPFFIANEQESQIENMPPEHYYCFPTLSDLKDEVNNYVKNEMEYKGELRDNIRTAIVARIDSLCVGAKGLMFNTYDFFPMSRLLTKNTVIEMENIADDDDKAFFVGLMLVLLSEYRQQENPSIKPGAPDKELEHLLVIEEAHRLLKNVDTEKHSEYMGNPKGKAVEVFCNVISEMRSLGQGVTVVEQIPTKISPDVIKNSNTKIAHRLVSKDDQSLLAGSLGISEEEALYLNRLTTGHILCHKEGMDRPIECSVDFDVETLPVGNDKIRRIMKDIYKPLHHSDAYELSTALKEEGCSVAVRLLNSLCSEEANKLEMLIDTVYAELSTLLRQNDLHHRYKTSIYPDFLTLRILQLLSRGIYCVIPTLPHNIKQVIFEVIKNKDIHQHAKMISTLGEYWDVENAVDHIANVVQELSIRYILREYCTGNKTAPLKNAAMAESVVSSFFLIEHKPIINKVTPVLLHRKDLING